MFLNTQAQMFANLEKCGYPGGDDVAGRMAALLEESFQPKDKTLLLERANEEISKMPGAKPVGNLRDVYMVVVNKERAAIAEPWPPADKEKFCTGYKKLFDETNPAYLGMQYYLKAAGMDVKKPHL